MYNPPNLSLKKAVKDRFGTQYKFAHKINVSPTLITLVVTNRWRLKPEEKVRWSTLLGKPVNELFPETCES